MDRGTSTLQEGDLYCGQGNTCTPAARCSLPWKGEQIHTAGRCSLLCTRGQAHTAGVCLHCGEGVQRTLQEGVGQGASAHCRKGFLNQGEEVGIPSLWIGQQSLLAGYFLYYGQRTSVQCRRMCLACTGGVPSLWVGGQEYTAGWYSFTDNRTSTLQEGMPSLRRGGQAQMIEVCSFMGEGSHCVWVCVGGIPLLCK